MTADPLAGIVPVMDEVAYHAHPALSSTGARSILDSPARFHYERTHPRPGRDVFDLGSAVHAAVLGVGHKITEYPPEHLTPSGNVSSKAATVAWVEEQRANGLVLISTEQAVRVKAMTEAVLAHPTARALLEQDTALKEASVFATDPNTGVDVRARFDLLATVSGDLKTADDASPSGFAKAVARHGYDVQRGWYDDALFFATGERRPFVFIVVESAAPHLVAVHQLDREFEEIGAKKAVRAREMYRACLDSGTWPGYPNEIQLTPPPMWHVYDFQDNYA